MEKHCTTLFSLAAGTLFLLTSVCATAQVSEQTPATQPATAAGAAQISTTAEQQQFSAAETYTKATQATTQPTEELTADNTAQNRKAAFQSLREQVKQQKMNPVKKAVVTTALKKMEKMQNKLEVKAAKQGKAVPSEYKTPLIIGIIGLALVIVGAFGIWPLYVIGGLALTAAVIWILLILLEVI